MARKRKGDVDVLDQDQAGPSEAVPEAAVKQGRSLGRGKKEPATPVTDPRVDLLSGWAQDIVRTGRYRKRLISAGVAIAVVVGLAFVGQQLRLFEARAQLRGEEQVSAQLTSQIQDLRPVETYMAAVEERAEIIQATMLTEVAFSSIMSELERVAPSGVELTTVTIGMKQPDPEEDPDPDDPSRGIFEMCAGPDPFRADIAIGCVQIGGSAADREAVAELIVRLDDSELFTEPFVQTTSTSPSAPVDFSGNVGIATTAFSGRFDRVVAEFEKALNPEQDQEDDQ